MKTRILLSSCILLLSVIPNACLAEQAIAGSCGDFPPDIIGESQHHVEAIPNPFYSYFKLTVPFAYKQAEKVVCPSLPTTSLFFRAV